jgi:hypothetical protein
MGVSVSAKASRKARSWSCTARSLICQFMALLRAGHKVGSTTLDEKEHCPGFAGKPDRTSSRARRLSET